MTAVFDLALGWTILALYAIAAGITSVVVLALGYRLAQMREQRAAAARRDRRRRSHARNGIA